MRVCRYILPSRLLREETFSQRNGKKTPLHTVQWDRSLKSKLSLLEYGLESPEEVRTLSISAALGKREWPFDLGSRQICLVFGTAPLLESNSCHLLEH